MSTMISICRERNGKEYRRKIFIGSIGGSSAANLLCRFCHVDAEIYSFVKEITDKEKELSKDIIFAEIIHLPESRIGNILLRPVLRDYEIPYLAKSYLNNEYQIKTDDLFVSIKSNRIILR